MTPNRLTAGLLALTAARRLTGLPYVYGGWPVVGKDGTDCSGLVAWAFQQVGITIARTTYEQYYEFAIGNGEQWQAGDLGFIRGSDPGPNGEPGHVFFYVSPGQIFQAPFTGEDIGQYPYDTSQFEFRTRPALALPLPYIPPQPTKFPSPQTLASHGYMLMVTGADAIEALANGWKLYMWNTLGFTDVSTLGPLPLGTHEFASIHYRTKNPS